MLDATQIQHAGLKRLVKSGDGRKINAKWLPKVKRVLAALDIAVAPGELDLPGFGFHELGTPRKGTYAVLITRNWRITFSWDDIGPVDVNLEDYHGR